MENPVMGAASREPGHQAVAAAPAPRSARLLHPLARFLRGEGPRDGPVTLDRARVFVLPTRLGLWFGLLLVVMLLGAVNYGNNLGMLFVFFLGSAAVVSILHTYHTLAGLEFRPGRTSPVFAGDTAGYRLGVRNPGAGSRRGVEFHPAMEGAPPVCADLPPGDSEVVLSCAVSQRGRSPLGRVTVASRHPVGLFRAWAHLEFRALECLVYPRPADPGPWPAGAGAVGSDPGGRGGGEDELSGLRPYVPGDSLRQVHWKASAKRDQLVVVERAAGAPTELLLDWEKLPGLGTEERLSRLCRGVLDADAAGAVWGLRLPGVVLSPAQGPEHRLRCLAGLAEFPP